MVIGSCTKVRLYKGQVSAIVLYIIISEVLANMFSFNITFYYLTFLFVFRGISPGCLQIQVAQKQTRGEINFNLQYRQFISELFTFSVVERDQGEDA